MSGALVALRGLGTTPFDSSAPPPSGPLQAAILAQRGSLIERGRAEAEEHGFEVCAQRVMSDMTVLTVQEPDGIPDDLLELHQAGKLHMLIYILEDKS